MSDIADFWRWFEENATRLREEPDGDAVCEEITDALENVNDGLIAEISRTASRDHATLVLSADGIKDLFPIIEAIHAEQPTVPGWDFVAFRQPADPNNPAVVEMLGRRLAVADMRFEHSVEDGLLELDVYVPGYTEDDDAIGNMCFIALDHTVGELRMETRIGGIAWHPIEDAPHSARPLLEILALMPN